MDSDDVNALVTIHVTLELQQAGNVNHGIFKVGFLFLNEAINHPFYLNSSTEYKNKQKMLLIYLRFIKDMRYLRSSVSNGRPSYYSIAFSSLLLLFFVMV